MSDYATKKDYRIKAGVPLAPHGHDVANYAAYLFDAPAQNEAEKDRRALEKHFKDACDLFAGEIALLSDRREPLSSDEAQKLARALAELLETHTLLHKDIPPR